MMNAVLAARDIDFSDSLALLPELRSGVRTSDVYKLGAELAFRREGGSSTVSKIIESLTLNGNCTDMFTSALSSEELDKVRLNDNEIAAYDRISRLASDGKVDVQGALEKSFAEDGQGVPAIAVLILVVVVLVAVAAK
jgi:hypothetical protein